MIKQYSIVWAEVKKEGETNGRPWKITEMTLKDAEGVETEKVSTFDAVNNGETVEGEIIKNDKGYLNFKKLSDKKPNMDRLIEKKQTGIIEAQGRKEESIGKAQDRSAMMWAKYGACELVANHPAFKDLNEVEVVTKISRLANQIYHDQLSPF